MASALYNLFSNESIAKFIQERLPELFYNAEVECSRAGKVGMEVGSVRESILISLLVHVFGERSVNFNIPITETEIDVVLVDVPISIKTKTGLGFNGIKAVWTVDPIKVKEFIDHFNPHCDIMLVQLVWNHYGGLFYLPLEAQVDIFNRIGRERYLVAPKPGTNPRGVEYSQQAIELALKDNRSRSMSILWKKPDKVYSKYDRWLDLWKES